MLVKKGILTKIVCLGKKKGFKLRQNAIVYRSSSKNVGCLTAEIKDSNRTFHESR